MASRIRNPAIQHFDKSTGAPLSGGQLFFFEIDSTTPKDTFSDEDGTISNTNPVILDANGLEPDIFGVGSFRVVLQNSDDVQQWERDPVNFETVGGQFSDFLASVDYAVNEVVAASDGDFYSSIQTPNLNNDPTTSPTFWTQTDLLKRWNIFETYDEGDPVTQSGLYYTSLTTTNLGNDPDTNPLLWLQNQDFRGCLAYNANAALTSSSATQITFDSELYDTDDIHDTTTSTQLFTVPTGITQIEITCQLEWVNFSDTTFRSMILFKNFSSGVAGLARSSVAAINGTNTILNMSTGKLDVASGDVFTVQSAQGSGGSVFMAINTTWFSMRIIK